MSELLENLMESFPPLAILGATSVLVMLAIELGYRMGVWRSDSRNLDSEALMSAMTGAHLALLAFIMAFSFSQAADHHSTRNELVLTEADAIAETYRRAGMLGEERREKLRVLIRDYVAVRLTAVDRHNFQPQRMIADSEKLLDKLWEECEQLGRDATVGRLQIQVVDAVDSLFQLHERRVSSAFNRISATIWVTLFFLLMLSMLGIGHFSGLKGRRNPVSSTVLALSFSLVLYLISDLDHPIAGMVIVDQGPILKLGERLDLNL